MFCSPPYDFYVDRADEMPELLAGLIAAAPADSVFVVEADARFDFATLPEPAGLGHPRLSARSRRNLSQGVTLMDVQNLGRVPAFTTKDGSEIRELWPIAIRASAIKRWPRRGLPPGGSTTPHHHSRPRKSTTSSKARA